jgi:glycogen debranching enzyme
VQEFKLKDLKASEFLFVPEHQKALICILTLENLMPENKNVSVELELAINIREREENLHDRKYTRNISGDKIIVSSSKGCFVFGSMPQGKIVSGEEYKEHSPSNELQRCFIPGIYKINIEIPARGKEEIAFIFACGENESEASSNFEDVEKTFPYSFKEKKLIYSYILSDSKFKSGIDSLDKLLQLNAIAMEKLAFDSKFGFGYFAGFPWFTQFWGRDLGWMIPAIVDYGNFENAKESLRTLAKFQSKEGSIPNTIYMNGTIDYNSIDSTPLWVIALEHYVINSGDTDFLKEMQDNFDRAMEWCRSKDVDNDGFLEHGNSVNDTWMDTLNRGVKAVEVQAFWIEALKSASNLYKILGNQNLSSSLKRVAFKLKTRFENIFWNENENFYYDRITNNGEDKRKTVNAVFPLLFNLSTYPKNLIEKLQENLWSPYGITTVSKQESTFNPGGYHTGSTWGFTTLALACAEFMNEKTEKGLEILDLMSKKMFENCVGAIGEVWNSENNELIGCCLQGWSSALAIRCIDEYFLGLKVNAFENSIIVSPSLLEGMSVERTKRIGDDSVDLRIERKNNRIKVDYISDKGKVYKIVVAPKV